MLEPSGFDIDTLNAPNRDRSHLVTVAIELVSDSGSMHARAMLLRKRWRMSPGAERTQALKKWSFSVELRTIRG
jgi:hypothetical protein